MTKFPACTDTQDALDEIARQKPKDLFKPLRVHFIGEDGIDAGGWGNASLCRVVAAAGHNALHSDLIPCMLPLCVC